MDPTIALLIVDLVAKVGIPLATELFEKWNKEEVTEEDIRNLISDLKKPEDFFA